MEADDIELVPLTRPETPPEVQIEAPIINCLVCLRDNLPAQRSDINIRVCSEHNIWVHMRCIRGLMGHNWYVECPNTFAECQQFKPELVVADQHHPLDYSVFTVKRSFYHAWIWIVVFSLALNVFATYSITRCNLVVYQSSCYIAGILSYCIANLPLPCLFFYYHPTVTTYFKFEHDYYSVKQKLISEGFVLGLASVSGVPLLVMIDEVFSSHLILAVWITIFSGFITPICCFALMHNLYEIFLQISSAEIVFVPTIVRSLSQNHEAADSSPSDL